MFGLPVGAEYTIKVHGDGDGAGYDDVFKLFVGENLLKLSFEKVEK